MFDRPPDHMTPPPLVHRLHALGTLQATMNFDELVHQRVVERLAERRLSVETLTASLDSHYLLYGEGATVVHARACGGRTHRRPPPLRPRPSDPPPWFRRVPDQAPPTAPSSVLRPPSPPSTAPSLTQTRTPPSFASGFVGVLHAGRLRHALLRLAPRAQLQEHHAQEPSRHLHRRAGILVRTCRARPGPTPVYPTTSRNIPPEHNALSTFIPPFVRPSLMYCTESRTSPRASSPCPPHPFPSHVVRRLLGYGLAYGNTAGTTGTTFVGDDIGWAFDATSAFDHWFFQVGQQSTSSQPKNHPNQLNPNATNASAATPPDRSLKSLNRSSTLLQLRPPS